MIHEENSGKVFRAWKEYPFNILNELEKENLVRHTPNQ